MWAGFTIPIWLRDRYGYGKVFKINGLQRSFLVVLSVKVSCAISVGSLSSIHSQLFSNCEENRKLFGNCYSSYLVIVRDEQTGFCKESFYAGRNSTRLSLLQTSSAAFELSIPHFTV
jgi:hypothetical protein